MCRVLAVCAFLLGLAFQPSLAAAKVKIDIDLSAQTMHVAAADGATYDWSI